MSTADQKGFTLIELLVVIAIIGLLSAIILASLNMARSSARDSERRDDMTQLYTSLELKYLSTGSVPTSGGLSSPGHGGLDTALTPKYISVISDDPQYGSGHTDYMYFREDFSFVAYCAGVVGRGTSYYGVYAKLEHPTASDLGTLTTPLDQCVHTIWGMNFRKGN